MLIKKAMKIRGVERSDFAWYRQRGPPRVTRIQLTVLANVIKDL